jgi:hypothetical protein
VVFLDQKHIIAQEPAESHDLRRHLSQRKWEAAPIETCCKLHSLLKQSRSYENLLRLLELTLFFTVDCSISFNVKTLSDDQ